jgi:outer membrane protein insertion porin family
VLLAAALIIRSVSVPGTQLHVKLATQVGDPYDERTIARDVRWLWSLGRFDDVRVEEPEPGALVFRIKQRPRLTLRDVRLTPHSFGLELKLPPGTPIDPASAREIARDVEHKLDARVEEKLVPRGRGKVDLALHVVKQNKKKRAEPSDEIQPAIAKELCRTLFLERRDAQRSGSLDFHTRFDLDGGLHLDRGRSYRVGRIEFTGNHRFSDSLLRRHMLLDEGAVFDERLLRRSIARLNRSGMFDSIDERRVLVSRDDALGVAHVTLLLSERGPRAWNLAGPWPLQASISSRLPKWATWAISVSLFGTSFRLLNLPRRFDPVIAIQRPFSTGEGWKSGFGIAPQLGLRGMTIGYAVGQIQHRLLPRISGEQSGEPLLPVEGDLPAACIAKPRLRLFRTAASAALTMLSR